MKRLEGKPFALIGVNVNAYSSKKLKDVMVTENLPWRSTADHGAIAAKWNGPGTPTYYVIDPAGVIRYKWVGHPGEKAIDTSIDKLIQDTERR